MILPRLMYSGKLVSFVGNRHNHNFPEIESTIVSNVLSDISDCPLRSYTSIYVSDNQYKRSSFTLYNGPIFNSSREYQQHDYALEADIIGIDRTTHLPHDFRELFSRISTSARPPLLVVIYMHFPLSLSPSIAKAVDFTVFTRDNIPQNRNKSYDFYFRDIFPTFTAFCDFMDDITTDGKGYFVLYKNGYSRIK